MLYEVITMFVGGTSYKHSISMGLVAAIGLFLVVLYKMISEGVGYFSVRIQSWRDPFVV